MDSERWNRMQALFHDAAEYPAGAWRAFLEDVCPDDPNLVGEVLALLGADARRTSLLERDVSGVARDLVGADVRGALDPRQFYPYQLKSLLGEGGMGVVYLAERPDLGSVVAIKILRDAWLSPARRRRFAAEQRTLAQLNHPGIARLYDAHTLDDGTPWFVLEYVDGVPLTDYCEGRGSAIDERLRLFRAVCEAVEYAHQHGIVHRDLKPSNILVKRDGTVRLLDFGIATHLDRSETAGAHPHTTVRLMTPAYAAPEQIRGDQAGVHTDVYSLGVILYELLTGRLPRDAASLDAKSADAHTVLAAMNDPVRPSAAVKSTARAEATKSTAAWSDLDVLCLTAMHADASRRYPSAASLIRDIDHFLNEQPLEARPDRLAYRLGKFVRRNRQAVAASFAMVVVVAALALAAGLAVAPAVFRGPVVEAPTRATVAVLPFLASGTGGSLDHLRMALGEETATALGYSRALAVRPFAATSAFDQSNRDVRRIGRDLGVAYVVTGGFRRVQGSGLAVDVEAVDVESGEVRWRDTFSAQAGNLIALQQQLTARAQAGLASALGVSNTAITATRPRNEEAYDLFLRSAGGRYDPDRMNTESIVLLEKAVALDPSYAPAWAALGRRYYVESRYQTGSDAIMKQAIAALERAIALDPNFIAARARLTIIRTEQQDLPSAHREAAEIVRRRPDSAEAHFALSYVLRFAGLLDEASRECATALSLDPHNWGWRSCVVVPLARGDYDGAMGYIQLDPGTEWAKALTIHALVSAGRETDALKVGRPNMPQWKSYDMLLACAARKPAQEIAALAAAVQPAPDPEMNYYAAAHLAYCGQNGAALRLLKRAIDGSYCSYPAIDTDPYFARLRGTPELAELRSQAVACQNAFRQDIGAN